MTLERYDVESRSESLIVRKLSLGRAPGVITPLLFDCKPEFLMFWRFPKRRHNPSYHTDQKSYFT